MPLSAQLHDTLREVARLTAAARDPWWLIGSAAVALHDAPVAAIADVDLLMSVADAREALRSLGIEPLPGRPDALFRSAVFGTWDGAPLPVEIMAGLDVAGAAGWRPVQPQSRVAVHVDDDITLYVPSRPELGAILASFGRPKDLERARLLGP